MADRFDLSYIKDKHLDDIDPFTVMGLFNRGITDDNRKAIAKELADFLGVDEAIAKELADFLGVDESVPNSFEGIPILNNQKSWFFGFEESFQIAENAILTILHRSGVSLRRLYSFQIAMIRMLGQALAPLMTK